METINLVRKLSRPEPTEKNLSEMDLIMIKEKILMIVPQLYVTSIYRRSATEEPVMAR